jgi:hypothetical protein
VQMHHNAMGKSRGGAVPAGARGGMRGGATHSTAAGAAAFAQAHAVIATPSAPEQGAFLGLASPFLCMCVCVRGAPPASRAPGYLHHARTRALTFRHVFARGQPILWTGSGRGCCSSSKAAAPRLPSGVWSTGSTACSSSLPHAPASP